MKDGVIAEQGTHNELLAANGVYRELFDTQFDLVINSDEDALNAVAGDSGAMLDVQSLGTAYDVRRLTEADITDVIMLARSNRRFYRQLGIRPSRARLTEIVSNIPKGGDYAGSTQGMEAAVGASDVSTYFVGFYDADDELVAVLDLICGYPEENGAFIGWFMVDADLQGQGVGSSIFADVRASLKAQGYDHLELRCPKASESALSFWEGQGFEQAECEFSGAGYDVVELTRDI